MKLLTIVVPCYHSENYMKQCIESLLPGGKEVEILIVDDGSYLDKTPEIADEYAKKYPEIVRCVHQENQGHGGAVNTGIAFANGLYFKVVDSDDYLEKSAYKQVLKTLRGIAQLNYKVDAVLTNYIYENISNGAQQVMSYKKMQPNEIITWSRGFHVGKFEFILMHSVIYRTELLREMGLKLPSHISYEDDIYALLPMGKVKKLYYMDVDLYRYQVGRPDQSVSEKVLLSKIDDHIYAVRLMLFGYKQMKKLEKHQEEYCLHFLDMMMCIADCVLDKAATKEAQEKKEELWNYAKVLDPVLYKKLKHSFYGRLTTLPGWFGRQVSKHGYQVIRKLYGFD